jgi:HEXXH motif-containing protein
MVDVLVHEASHLLLFGLVGGKALSRNDPAARYASPLRRDPRPIDGIFHAAFVATRVHLTMERMRSRAEATLHADIDRHATKNREAALIALDVLRRELLPTPEGQGILDALEGYWQAAHATRS